MTSTAWWPSSIAGQLAGEVLDVDPGAAVDVGRVLVGQDCDPHRRPPDLILGTPSSMQPTRRRIGCQRSGRLKESAAGRRMTFVKSRPAGIGRGPSGRATRPGGGVGRDPTRMTPMKRSTTAVSLALVGSAVFLAGCSRDPEDDERGGTAVHGGGHVVPFIGRGLTGGTGGDGYRLARRLGPRRFRRDWRRPWRRILRPGPLVPREAAPMQRMTITPRSGWQAIVESQGMLFHSSDDRPYWDEGCYYLFEAKEIDQIEAATTRSTRCAWRRPNT